jgi:hypothetical protein
MHAAVEDVPRPSVDNADQLAEPVPARTTPHDISIRFEEVRRSPNHLVLPFLRVYSLYSPSTATLS